MVEEGHLQSYKGHSIMVYRTGSIWHWQTIVFDESPKFLMNSSAALSKKEYANKEEAIAQAEKHIDKVLKKKGSQNKLIKIR